MNDEPRKPTRGKGPSQKKPRKDYLAGPNDDRKPGSRRPLKKPKLGIMTTTLWEYPSQHYGDSLQGSPNYTGATPSWVIWQLLMRYTKPRHLVVDPMVGSGTTIDVARDLDRRAIGYDLAAHTRRPDVFAADARKLPLEDAKADFVFIDPPYSTHVDYSEDPRCIGKLDASPMSADRGKGYYKAMGQVIAEIDRILKPGAHMALYVSDSYRKGQPFMPIGFDLFAMLRERFEPIDIISVVRHNDKLTRGNWHKAAEEGNFFLRGFNYCFIMRKYDERSAQRYIDPPPAAEKQAKQRSRGGGKGSGNFKPYTPKNSNKRPPRASDRKRPGGGE